MANPLEPKVREDRGGLPHLLVFGAGFVGQAVAQTVMALGWSVTTTVRHSPDTVQQWFFDGRSPLPFVALAGVTHILSTIPPTESGDPVLPSMGDALRSLCPRWVGYISSTAIYGDHQGGWVDETTFPTPQDARAVRRLEAEHLWLNSGLPIHLFRAAGIYGVGRSTLDAVRQGRAQRIIKSGQVFGRIHVDDIVQTILSSMARPNAGSIYNLSDDEPAPPQDVVLFACQLLGVEPPPEQPWAQVCDQLSPMTQFFYRDNKRVRNNKIKEELKISLRYPDYRSGLCAILEQEKADERNRDCGRARVAP